MFIVYTLYSQLTCKYRKRAWNFLASQATVIFSENNYFINERLTSPSRKFC